MAQLFNKLMSRLGHQKYYLQGGDWGALIGNNMAALFPNNTRAFHSNMCASMGPKSTIKLFLASFHPTLFMSPEEAKLTGFPLSETFFPTMLEESGYFHLQATKPDTVGVGLSNSPMGLLAYILEKFSTWTNKENRNKAEGGLEPYYKMDELLDNIMVYWVTNSITTSMRLYSEAFNFKQLAYKMDRVAIKIPTACLQGPKEAFGGSSKFVLQDQLQNLQRYNIASKGGHFLAFEAPEVLADDVVAFFASLEKSKSF